MDGFELSGYLKDREGSRGICKSCSKSVGWSKDRLAAHKRTNCPTATEDEKRKFSKRSLEVNLSSSQNELDQSFSGASMRVMTSHEIDSADEKLANFFFRSGVSLRLLDSATFKDFVNTINPSYAASLPTAKKLSGPLLDQQYKKCQDQLSKVLDSSLNLTLFSDGWTNVRGDHLVNFCIKAPEQKPIFYRSVNTSGKAQNAVSIAEEIMNVIDELGSEKFCCIITDNAPVMKLSWKIIEAKYSSIAAYGCAAHGLNLLVKDILDTPENVKLMKNAEKIIKFVTNHHMVKSKYEERRKIAKIAHTLTMSVPTRWFSRFTSLNDLLSSKYVLIQLADEESDQLKEINPKNTSASVLGLIKSNEFWNQLAKLVKTIEYPANIIGELRFLSYQN